MDPARTFGPPRVEERTLLAADGVPVSAVHRSGPAGGLAFVVAHGFSGSQRSSSLARVAHDLAAGGEAACDAAEALGGSDARVAAVVSLDFRGHGRSHGVSTLGNAEVLDLDAAVRWARLLGYTSVATVGFSMGASVVVRHAALKGGVDAVVSVSGPSRWFYRGTPTMRRLHYLVERPSGRLVVRLAMRTRIDDRAWDPVPAEPRALAPRVAPTPLLVVHGDRDRFFPLDHARELAEAGGPTAQLWIEPGFGHAEAAITPALTYRIATWVREQLVAAGPVPR
jgi:pimeloyl-ACP methyl ester carboxylesterase